jgi:hypothetical protein
MAADVVTQASNGIGVAVRRRRADTDPTAGTRPGFYAIFGVSFVVFLLIALLGLLSAQRWRRWLPGAEHEHTLIGGVTSAVYTFMSYLP